MNLSTDKQNELLSGAISEIVEKIRSVTEVYEAGLHEPVIGNSELSSVSKCIASGFVSSVGPEIRKFEDLLCKFTGAKHAIAVSSGTAALHLMLIANGISCNSEVLVPALTFVASGNAILQSNAIPHFVDSSTTNLGVNVLSLDRYLASISEMRDGKCWNSKTGRMISCIMPVHVFGNIGDIDGLKELAKRYGLLILEDAAEALGSKKGARHAGLFGECGALSFNGNKIVTTGGGGAIITNDNRLAERLRSLATTAKRDHPFLYWHEELGFNYRMPALNAALGIAQLERLEVMLNAKLLLREAYQEAFATASHVNFFNSSELHATNNWLNAIYLNDSLTAYRDVIIEALIEHGYHCRPVWDLLSKFPHFKNCPSMPLVNSEKLAERLICIPSSATLVKSLCID